MSGIPTVIANWSFRVSNKFRHQQPSLWEGLFAEEVAELWEPWMRVGDELLEDEDRLEAVYEA